MTGAERHLGRQVEVTYDKDASITGKLLEAEADGGFSVELADGTVRYCWPLLSIRDAEAESEPEAEAEL